MDYDKKELITTVTDNVSIEDIIADLTPSPRTGVAKQIGNITTAIAQPIIELHNANVKEEVMLMAIKRNAQTQQAKIKSDEVVRNSKVNAIKEYMRLHNPKGSDLERCLNLLEKI